jgi:hypothetical protein
VPADQVRQFGKGRSYVVVTAATADVLSSDLAAILDRPKNVGRHGESIVPVSAFIIETDFSADSGAWAPTFRRGPAFAYPSLFEP